MGRFLDDYEAASLARGVTVPPYLAQNGVTEQEYVKSQTGDVKTQGALGAIVLLVVYGATVVRGSRDRLKAAAAKKKAAGAKAREPVSR